VAAQSPRDAQRDFELIKKKETSESMEKCASDGWKGEMMEISGEAMKEQSAVPIP